MSLQDVARKFVELCRQGKNFDVMRTMYSPTIVSVEGDGKETAGQGPVIKKSEGWVSDKTFNGETVAGPFYNGANPDQFVVYFTLDITPKATGKRITLEEVGVYTVKDDKITREQFFYDGEHCATAPINTLGRRHPRRNRREVRRGQGGQVHGPAAGEKRLWMRGAAGVVESAGEENTKGAGGEGVLRLISGDAKGA